MCIVEKIVNVSSISPISHGYFLVDGDFTTVAETQFSSEPWIIITLSSSSLISGVILWWKVQPGVSVALG